MKINPKSWHAELYILAGNSIPSRINLCAYTRGVLKGFLICCCIVVVCVFFGVFALDPIATLIGYLITGYTGPFLSEVTFSVGSCIYISIVIVFLSWLIFKGFQKLKPETTKSNLPEFKFIKTVYRSYKDKFCPILEVEKD